MLIKEVQIGLFVRQDQSRSEQRETFASIDEPMQGNEAEEEELKDEEPDR